MVFSVVHPVVTSHDGRASTSDARTSWQVDDYFASAREQVWMAGAFGDITAQSRKYVVAFQEAGLALTALSECAPRRDRFAGEAAEYERRRRLPLFPLLAGRCC